MKTYILLLRGINVGGHNLIPMKALTALLTGLGFKNVKTYIQSGNVVLQSDVALDQGLQYTLHFIIGDTSGTGVILFLFYQLLKLNLKWRRHKNG